MMWIRTMLGKRMRIDQIHGYGVASLNLNLADYNLAEALGDFQVYAWTDDSEYLVFIGSREKCDKVLEDLDELLSPSGFRLDYQSELSKDAEGETDE